MGGERRRGLQIGLGLLIREGRGKKGDGVRKSRNTAMTEGERSERSARLHQRHIHVSTSAFCAGTTC